MANDCPARAARFQRYRTQVREHQLHPDGHGDSRPQRPRGRSATELVGDFLRLLRPFQRQVIGILVAATAATFIGLLPPAGTKFVIDYGLSGNKLPEPWLAHFPQLATRRRSAI